MITLKSGSNSVAAQQQGEAVDCVCVCMNDNTCTVYANFENIAVTEGAGYTLSSDKNGYSLQICVAKLNKFYNLCGEPKHTLEYITMVTRVSIFLGQNG